PKQEHLPAPNLAWPADGKASMAARMIRVRMVSPTHRRSMQDRCVLVVQGAEFRAILYLVSHWRDLPSRKSLIVLRQHRARLEFRTLSCQTPLVASLINSSNLALLIVARRRTSARIKTANCCGSGGRASQR